MSMTSTTRPTRTAFARKCTRLASHHEREEARRAVRHAMLLERSQAIIGAAIKRGDITPRPGSPEWMAIINEGLESGLLRKPQQHNGRKDTNGRD